MAAGDLNIALVLKLVDQATAPARAVTGALRRIGMVTEETGRAGVAWANEQIAANQARRSALMGEAFGVAAVGGALAAALKPAIAFEAAMAGVSKVIDFDNPAGLKALERDILALTTSEGLPMAAEGIAAIIEAAGQAGVVDKALPDDQEREQLIAFARSAAQMGVAFDISAEAAGSAMAQWRASMKLSQERSLILGDAINHLSNNMNASAPALVDVIQRQGAVAMSAGLAETEVAAFAAAFLSGGASPEIAATALKNFTGALTDGEAMTNRQRAVMEKLGFDAEELAKRMQVDAKGAIIDVMEALSELPEHAQGAALSQLFGEESKGAIAPLLTNLDLLRGSFELVGDQAQFTGSMLAEYAKQAETTSNALIVVTNYLKAMAIAVGSVLLPEIRELLAAIQPVLGAMIAWAEAHPELISLVFRLTAGLLLFRLGSIALRWALFSILAPILQIIRAANWLLILLPRLGRALLALLNPMKLIRGALIALRFAFMATGIGALLTGIAMAGIWIYNNWAGLKEFFAGFWAAFRDALGPAADRLDDIIARARLIWQWFTDILGPVEASAETWRVWGENAGAALARLLAQIADLDAKSAGLISTTAVLYGGFMALRLTLLPLRGIARAILWIGKGPVRALILGLGGAMRAFLWLGRMAPVLMRGIGSALVLLVRNPVGFLLAALRLIGSTVLWLGRLVMANPIGAVITAIAALAYVAYDNWDRIVGFIIAKVDAVKAAFDQGLLNGVFKLLAEFNPFTLAVEGMQGLVAYVMELLGVPEQIVAAFRAIDLFQIGVDIIQTLWDGMASLIDLAVSAITARFAALKPQWLTDLQNWVVSDGGGDRPAAAADGADYLPPSMRDRGGPVRAGIPYLVGERSPEIFVPGISGSILPGRVLKAAMAASAMSAPVAAMPPQAEIIESFDRRPALSAPPPAPRITRQGDTFNITIAPPPGADEETIIRLLKRELAARQDARRGDLHDGVDY